jgi:hypothetical protein
MTTSSGMSLVLRDTEGRYYEFSEEALEAARVGNERQRELEDRLGDVQGFANPGSFKGTDLGPKLDGAITPSGPVIFEGGAPKGKPQPF